MGDITHPTRARRLRAVPALLGGFAGALAVAGSAFAYTIFGTADDAPFLAAGAQPARSSAATEVTPPPLVTPRATATPSAASADAPALGATPATPSPSTAATSSTPPPPASTPAPASATLLGTPAAVVSAPAPPPPASPAPALPPPVAALVLSAREQGLVDAMNARRSTMGVMPLSVSGALTGVARTRSADMLANNYFAHSSPSGQTWYSLLSTLSLTYAAGGENLAKVSGDAATSVSLAIEALMASPTHRANILNPAYRFVGVGSAVEGETLTIFTSIFTDR